MSFIYNSFIMLEVKNLNFQYPSSEVIFTDLSFELPGPALIHLKGANGCGKTTLLKIISSLIIPSEGTIHFNKKVLHQDNVSYMPSQPESSFVQLTGKETLELFSRLNRCEGIKKEYFEVLNSIETFKQALNTKFAFCSTGMKQIINLARSLSKRSHLLLLDEPLHGLDKETKAKLVPLFEDIKKEATIILTSHEDPFLKVDHSYVLSDGRLERV